MDHMYVDGYICIYMDHMYIYGPAVIPHIYGHIHIWPYIHMHQVYGLRPRRADAGAGARSGTGDAQAGCDGYLNVRLMMDARPRRVRRRRRQRPDPARPLAQLLYALVK